MKRIYFLFTIVIILNSCDSDLKPVIFETIESDTAFEANISAIYDRAVDVTLRSKTLNQNIENTIIETLSSTQNKTDLSTVLHSFNEEYLAFKKEFSDNEEPVWKLNIETEITYQSETIITIAISTYEFKGGAHGNDKIRFLNLDANSGEILNIEDIIKNIESFKTLAKNYFIKSLGDVDETVKMEDFFFGKPFQVSENFGFTDDGLVLLYNPYEVVSYNQGYTEFVIPFEDVKPYLNFI